MFLFPNKHCVEGDASAGMGTTRFCLVCGLTGPLIAVITGPWEVLVTPGFTIKTDASIDMFFAAFCWHCAQRHARVLDFPRPVVFPLNADGWVVGAC